MMPYRRALPTILAALTVAALATPQRVAAQDEESPNPSPTARLRTIDYVVNTMSRNVRQAILIDSVLAGKLAPLPSAPTTVENFESQLDSLAKSLGPGVTWEKVYLPALPSGRVYRADDLAEFLLAQARLFGKPTRPAQGWIEVLGKKLSEQQSDAVVTSLNLRPHYILTNLTARLARRDGFGERDFSSMSPEDQAAWAANQAAKFRANPQAAQQFMQQGLMVMRNFITTMSQEERTQFFQNIGPLLGGGGFPGGRPPQ